ncbi:MAG: hypothetical protein CVT47_00515 [Thermoplasmata archaeon HGW-Thermoplasmata-2]|nr:MAG: hypothetical protein CVT47_00515 [Thermoplasmata archaeon HGW-Thermoplasmata-2]
MSKIKEMLDRIPNDKRLESTNRTLEKMISSTMESAFKNAADRKMLLKLLEESGRRAGENFAKEVIAKYGIEITDAPSAMAIMNIASFFDGAKYETVESAKRRAVKRIDALDFTGGERFSHDVVEGTCAFLKGYYSGAANAGERRFRTEFNCSTDEQKCRCEAVVEDTSEFCEKKWVDIPEEVKRMSREERLGERRKYLALTIGHIEIVLLDAFGFETASKMSMEATYPIGLEAGARIMQMFGLGNTPEDIYMMHFISTHMMEIKTEKMSVTDDVVMYNHAFCPFAEAAMIAMDYLNINDAKKRGDAKFIICEGCKGFASGLTHAVSKEWETYSPKRLSAGDPYCLFLLSRGGGGGEINLSSY